MIARILANPKYTGHMVYGRTATKNGKHGRKTPADRWLWSAEPAHAPLVTRAQWDAAQTVGAEHGTSRDDTDIASHPAAAETYPLRGIIRCPICTRRMTGRRKTGSPATTSAPTTRQSPPWRYLPGPPGPPGHRLGPRRPHASPPR